MAPPKSVARKLADAKERLRGHHSMRFQIELTPYYADGVPSDITDASFLWQRGSKLQYTKMAKVSQAEGIVHWDQVLKQTTTVYRSGNAFDRKEYSFKLQGLRSGNANEKPRTFAKLELDLAAYCSVEASGCRDLLLELRPRGRLHLGLRATWLQNSDPAQDSLTDLSQVSLGPSSQPSSSTALDDQDLNGFHDQDMSLKAVHGQPQHSSAAQFSQPSSMPLPRGDSAQEEAPQCAPAEQRQHHAEGNAACGVPPKGRGMGRVRQGHGFRRSSSGPGGELLPEEPDLAERIRGKSAGPACSADAGFTGFHTIALDEDDMATPTIPRKATASQAAGHRKSQSEPGALVTLQALPRALSEISETPEPRPPGSPEDYATIVRESRVILLSSDSEAEEDIGPLSVMKRWLTGRKTGRPSGSRSPFAMASNAHMFPGLGPDAEAVDRQAWPPHGNAEESVGALREMCRGALRERDAAWQEAAQAERRAVQLERDVGVLAHAKRGMAERLEAAEGALMALAQEDLMIALVHAKLAVAQKDWARLEVQGDLYKERRRNMALRAKVTRLETDYHAALNARRALPPSPGAQRMLSSAASTPLPAQQGEEGQKEGTLEGATSIPMGLDRAELAVSTSSGGCRNVSGTNTASLPEKDMQASSGQGAGVPLAAASAVAGLLQHKEAMAVVVGGAA